MVKLYVEPGKDGKIYLPSGRLIFNNDGTTTFIHKAKGDGKTDDTAVIQAAIDAVAKR